MSQKSVREDGRKAMTVYLRPDLIQGLKVLALQQETHAYVLVEQLVEGLLEDEAYKPSKETD